MTYNNKIIVPESYFYVTAFLTLRCNLSCSYCLSALDKDPYKRGFKELSGEQWVRGLNKIEVRPEVPITLTGGEPTLHKDFFYIVNNLRDDLNIDLLTNLDWSLNVLERFLAGVDPARLRRHAPYPSIRVSYHPGQIDGREMLVRNVDRLQTAGFSIGVYSVLYPSPGNLSSIVDMQYLCRNLNIDFRVKEFVGTYKIESPNGGTSSILYGNYSHYPDSVAQERTKSCSCKTTELIIAPDGNIYRCHRDLYSAENPVGNILDNNYEVLDVFRDCVNYGQCHPCDTKTKTDYKQRLGHTSVVIKDIQSIKP